ncbi:hypothetical protein NEOLEDRAFT_1059869 [Neolentinus lepideus HHB14362 ss-1]|uniref:Zn(2)-C6 fungal-type domain-containing protein n=1 Tax=Neolentinus lepideus HHB14362 ss-1 TaxID=1314782 RepID=A0A165U8E9_9AGAM|nr:hypothetical protein NEOLEDRAFT_1059869 [Neolentinus lepideus HHB14362 ss-1]
MSTSPISTRRNEDGHENGLNGGAKKRRRGATRLSCAECRRLKLRCDRKVPCSSCVKRGCGAICPDGSLTTGQGNRFVLASTQELHEKISELSLRVRELEDGLRVSHSKTTSEQHPLLSDELLKIKAPLQREPSGQRNSATGGPGGLNGIKEEESKPDVVDAIGSLSISDSGRTKYFGHTANSWYFLQNESPEEDRADDRLVQLSNILPHEILSLTGSFPIIRMVNSDNSLPVDRLQSLSFYLPPYEVAVRLRDIYYHHAAWMYDPVPVDYFNEHVFFKIYTPGDLSPVEEDLLSPRLSLMFMVLAIGTLMDTKQPAYNLDAEKYHHLARASLFQSSLFDEPSLNSVQALFLMSFYLFLSDRHGTGAGSRWAIMGMAVKLAQSHQSLVDRDIGKWKVDPTETLQRRNTFWELYTYDSWQCLTFGRPPSFSLAHVDCKMAQPDDQDPEQVFHAWKHRFVSECMSVVHDQAFGAKTPTYSTVVQLDRKLRAFPVPAVLQIAGFGATAPDAGSAAVYPESVSLILQRHIVLAIREMNLLYMHRSFFARALSDHPKDPLGSPYGTSVIAAYRSAGSLVALMRNLHSQLTDLTERIFFLWTHMFSCAIILGSIVTRCPSMSLAPSALVQLDSACELFAKAARGFRAQKVLTIMLRLKEKAHSSLAAFREGKSSPTALRLPQSPSEPPTPVDDDDELSTLGGKTRVVARKDSGSPPSMRSPTTLNPVVPLPLTPNTDRQVHPTVVEYLRSFEPLPSSMEAGSMAGTSMHVEPSHYNDAGQLSMSYVANNQMATSYEQQSPVATNGAGYAQAPYFPQYFPVYDYAPATHGADYPYASSSMPHMNGYMSTERERSSGSPEASMQTTWQEFVEGFTMS